MIVDEVLKLIPEGQVKYVERNEDPRDYRVTFEKIYNRLNFVPRFKVADGISQIKKALDDGFILNPEDPKYKNVW